MLLVTGMQALLRLVPVLLARVEVKEMEAPEGLPLESFNPRRIRIQDQQTVNPAMRQLKVKRMLPGRCLSRRILLGYFVAAGFLGPGRCSKRVDLGVYLFILRRFSFVVKKYSFLLYKVLDQ